MRLSLWLFLALPFVAGCNLPMGFGRELPDHELNSRYSRMIESLPANQPFTFAVLGDTRPADNPVHHQFLNQIQKRKPDFAVNGGDFVTWGKSKEYAIYLKTLANYKIPYLHVVGNHDWRLEGYTYAFKDVFGPDEYVVDIGRWRLIVINNCHEFRYGFSSKQLRWLDKQMLPGKHVVLFAHAPTKQPFKDVLPRPEKSDDPPTRQKKDLHHEDEFLVLMDRKKPRMVIFGHNHMYANVEVGPTRYIITAGGGAELHGHELHPPTYGFMYHCLLFTANPDGSYACALFDQHGRPWSDFDFKQDAP